MHCVKTKIKSLLIAVTFILTAGISHTTSAATYYVSNAGNDAQSGSSLEDAWETVNHAAGMVVAGDTVLIAGGTYPEAVRIRASGEKGRPITFKAIPGHKVIFDGVNRTLGYAFIASYQSHLRFDSLYFTGYNFTGNLRLPWSDNWPGNDNSSTFVLNRCDDVQITRCFSDGSGPGYNGGLVIARYCKDLLVKNCVMTSAMGGGVYILYSHNARVENNVFLVNLIYATIYQNDPKDPGSLTHNIITDNIAPKHHVKLLYNTDTIDANTHTNCFFVRNLDATHPWDKYETLQKWMDHVAATYKHEGHMSQVVADPMFKATIGAKPLDRKGNPMFLGDYLLEKADLDFDDLFSTNPDLIKRNIGLEAEKFNDFHFMNNHHK